jgi:hypothetical protein
MSCTLVEPGKVGIKVYLAGNKKGQMDIKSPGRYGVGVNVKWYQFPYINRIMVFLDKR